MKINDENNENSDGYIVVETVGAFVPFLLLVISILSLVNIITVQARVHFALTQAAKTISMYCYALEVLGVANELTTLDNKANRVAEEANAFRGEVGGVIDGINSLSGLGGAITSGSDATDRVVRLTEETAGDPVKALQNILNFSLSQLEGYAFELLARPLVGRYLANGEISGDAYLEAVGVVSGPNQASTGLNALEFYSLNNLGRSNSVLIDRNGNVKLIVRYEIKYTFAGLPLPFGPTIKITQTVITKAWLNGSGRGYY